MYLERHVDAFPLSDATMRPKMQASVCNGQKYRDWNGWIVNPSDMALNIHYLLFRVLQHPDTVLETLENES